MGRLSTGTASVNTPGSSFSPFQNNAVSTPSAASSRGTRGRLSSSSAVKPVAQKKESIGDTALNFVRNLPTTLLRGFVQPGEAMLKTVSAITKAVVPDVITRSIQSYGAAHPDLAKAARSYQQGSRSTLTLPTQTEPVFQGLTPYASAREAIGGTLEAGLNLGLDALTFGTGGVALAAGKATAKEVAERGVSAIIKKGVQYATSKEGATAIGKAALADFGIGAGYGTATALQDPNATAGDVISSATKGGLLNVVATPVLGKALGGLIHVGGKASAATGEAIDRLATTLEKTAGMSKTEAESLARLGLERNAEGKIARPTEGKAYGDGFIYPIVPERLPTRTEKVAGAAAGALRTLERVPYALKRGVDRYAGIFTKMNDTRLHDIYQASGGVGRVEGRNLFDQFMKEGPAAYGSDWELVARQRKMLDAIDRSTNGLAVEGGYSLPKLNEQYHGWLDSLTPEQRASVGEAQTKWNDLMTSELDKKLNNHSISPQEYAYIKAAHPNFIPHQVLDAVEKRAEEMAGGGPVGGVGKNQGNKKMLKAKGSTREIQDPTIATSEYLIKNAAINAKQDADQAFRAAIEGSMDTFEITPLRRSEDVLARAELKAKAHAARKEVEALDKVISKHDKAIRKTLKDINDLNKQGLGLKLREQPKVAPERKVGTITVKRMEEYVKENAPKSFDELANSYGIKGILQKEFGSFDNLKQDVVLGGWQRLVDVGIPEATAESVAKQIFKEPTRYPLEISVREKAPTITSSDVRNFVAQLVDEPSSTLNRLHEMIGRRDEKASQFITELQHFQEARGVINEERKAFIEEIKAHNDEEISKLDIPKGYDVYTMLHDGVKERYLMPKELADSLRGGGGTISGGVMRWLNANPKLKAFLSAPANVIRGLTTKYNPVFQLFNVARDVQTVQITAKASAADYMKAFVSSVFHEDPVRGELHQLIDREGALSGNNLFDESVSAAENIAKYLEKSKIKLARTVEGKTTVKGKFGFVKDTLLNAGQILEETSRLAAAQNALRNGATAAEAAKIARNSTVDFQRHGDLSQLINTFIPFFNPRVQGVLNLKNALVRDPEAFVRRMSATALIPATALFAWNSQHKSYWDIPENDRRQYWIIMTGESQGVNAAGKRMTLPHYIRIPKGEAQIAASSIVDRVLSVGKDKYPADFGTFVSGILGSISPVTESSLIPAGAQQLVELGFNKSLFRNAPIEPDYTYIGGERFKTSELSPKYHYNDYTSETAKLIGSVFNLSPERVDYIIRIGVMDDVLRLLDMPSAAAPTRGQDTSPFFKASNLPLVRSVLKTSNSRGYYYNKDKETKKATVINDAQVQRRLLRELRRSQSQE